MAGGSASRPAYAARASPEDALLEALADQAAHIFIFQKFTILYPTLTMTKWKFPLLPLFL